MIFILASDCEFFKNIMPYHLVHSYCDGQAVPLDLEAHDNMIVQYTGNCCPVNMALHLRRHQSSLHKIFPIQIQFQISVCSCGIPERCDVSACACPAGIPHGRLPGIVDSGIALNELPDGTAFQVQWQS